MTHTMLGNAFQVYTYRHQQLGNTSKTQSITTEETAERMQENTDLRRGSPSWLVFQPFYTYINMSRKTVKDAGRQKQSDGVDQEVPHSSPLHQARPHRAPSPGPAHTQAGTGCSCERASRVTRGIRTTEYLLISTNSTLFPLTHSRLLYPLSRCSPSKTQTKPHPTGHPKDHKCNTIKKQEVINERKSSASLL